MAFDFRALKAEKKPLFHKEYRKYYPVESLESVGFTRKVCECCGRGFWSASERSVCDEPTCSGGYRFIGEKLTKKRFKYKEAWDEYVKTFKKWGYEPIKRYPVVCRWYEDLYFVNAGINDFQPYVVAGDVEPPAPAVLEPQFCLRFQDIDSVGITGRHYSGFIMVGQHTFNTAEKHVYFKDEGILQIHEFLTKGMGIPDGEITYHEDVWAGGGNYGPSMEFFSRGLELGNQVYMQYELLPDGTSRELKTKVIDMGAGLERWSWFSQGTPMSYDSTFPKVMEYLYKTSSYKKDNEFMMKFGHYAGLLDLDEVDDIGSVWGNIAKDVGVDLDELKKKVFELRSLYAIADHTRTLLVAIHDGALPSNVGGGYNLRNILRRCWMMNDEYGHGIELEKVFEKHIKEFGTWYTDLKEVGSLYDIIDVEKKRYEETQQKGKKIIEKMGVVDVEKMVELYDSHGISPEVVQKISGVEVPDNFFRLVEERHERISEVDKKEEKTKVPDDVPETILGYYEDQSLLRFSSKIVGIIGDKVALEKTYFYPEGGGQEADNGEIAGKRVKYVEKIGKVVLHTLDDAKGLSQGQKVDCTLDDARRKQLMQHHTATHLVNAAAREILGPHIWQAGSHKSIKSSRLDITHYKTVTDEQLKKIEETANKYVKKSATVDVSWMKRKDAEEKYGMRLYQGGAVPGTELRIINVRGVDVEACGGTHLQNTKDVGEIWMLSAKRIQDGVVRLEFTAGGASEKHAGAEEDLMSEVRKRLGVKSGEEFSLAEVAGVFAVPVNQLTQTIERFTQEYEQDSKTISAAGGAPDRVEETDDVLKRSKSLFEAWKANKKLLRKTQDNAGEDVISEISSMFAKDEVVKFKTDGLSVKALTDIAEKAVAGGGKTLIIINNVGDKVNVVVASSAKHNAGEICKKLCAELGGGGGGKPTLAMGGGNADKADEKLAKFKID